MKIKIFCRCSFFLPGRDKELSAPLYSDYFSTASRPIMFSVYYYYYYYYYRYSALGSVWAETRAQSGDCMALVRCILGKFL